MQTFRGQTKCMMGDVQMANAKLLQIYYRNMLQKLNWLLKKAKYQWMTGWLSQDTLTGEQ